MSVSIRKLPKELEKQIVSRARKEHKTKTQVIVQALENVFSLGPRALKRGKLRAFFGKMTPDQARAFEDATFDFSKVDEELWKK